MVDFFFDFPDVYDILRLIYCNSFSVLIPPVTFLVQQSLTPFHTLSLPTDPSSVSQKSRHFNDTYSSLKYSDIQMSVSMLHVILTWDYSW